MKNRNNYEITPIKIYYLGAVNPELKNIYLIKF